MEKIELDYDEAILMKSERVSYGGVLSSYTNELILTNKNIVLVKKGMFGMAKGTIKFPIAEIKTFEGQPQVLVGKAKNSTPTLDVYFRSSQESFGFEWKKDAVKWVEKITELMTGKKATINTNTRLTIPGTEFVARTLKGTLDTYKDAFGLTKKEERVARFCSSCGASLSGIKGETEKCPYCGTFITF